MQSHHKDSCKEIDDAKQEILKARWLTCRNVQCGSWWKYLFKPRKSDHGAFVTPDVNSGHEIFFMLRLALHRTVVHRQLGIGTPTVLAVFADCKIPRCVL